VTGHPPAAPPPDDVLTAFGRWLRHRGYRPGVVASYVRTVRRWLTSGQTPQAWLNAVHEASRPAGGGYPTRSAGVYYKALRAYWESTGQDAEGQAAPPRSHRYRKPKQQQALTPTQDRAFMVAALAQPEPYATILVLLRHLGLRVNEACALRLADVHLAPPRLVLPQTKTTSAEAGDLPEELPLPRTVLAALHTYLREAWSVLAGPEQSPWLFPSPVNGQRPVTDRSVRRAIERVAHDAELTVRITPHTLRHTLATRLAERGVPQATIQVVLRHADPRSTTIYQHHTAHAEDVRAALEGEEA